MDVFQTQLARLDRAAPPTIEGGQFVAFTCGGNTYAVPIMCVQEIRSWQGTTPIPRRTAASRGVLDIRGNIVEVLELGVLLGSQPKPPGPESVVIVLAANSTTIGILADSVFDILQAAPADLMPAPANVGDALVSAIINHSDRLVSIIDPEQLNVD